MRTSSFKINPILEKQISRTFAQLITDFNSLEDAQIFLRDFFNDSEYETFAKRMAVAYWLRKGRSYSNIKQNLKVSSATIATVQTLLTKPGFKLAIKKIEAEEWANQWAKRIQKLTKGKK